MKSVAVVRNAIAAYIYSKTNCTHRPDCTIVGLNFPLSELEQPEQNKDVLTKSAKLMEAVRALPEHYMEGHRFWHFEWHRAAHLEVIICCCVLLVAGILCSAGGIGGGGIYVSVLMLGGGLSVHDAVQLSKAIVFFGSLSSLVLNMRKTFNSPNGATTLINFNIIRLVVPASLLGTYIGVFLNRILPGTFVLSVLFAILVGMSGMVIIMTYRQYVQEEMESQPAGKDVFEAQHFPAPATIQRLSTPSTNREGFLSDRSEHRKTIEPLRSKLTTQDIIVGFIILVCVIGCGVIRYHAETCMTALRQEFPNNRPEPACHHPATFYMGHKLQRWMGQSGLAEYILQLLFIFPILMCVLIAWYYCDLCAMQGWSYGHILKYQAVSLITGSLSGLVGIGGGLIFSPFFLIMGIEPSIAVATSSTAVLFTAASTSFQYYFTDRTVVSLMVIYSIVTLVSSYAGTWLVHFLQDKYLSRRSYITAIVGCGVILSAMFTAMKFVPGGGPVH